jgi:hypothetical protein
MSPTPINPKIDMREIKPITFDVRVPELKISEVEMSIKEGLRRLSL